MTRNDWNLIQKARAKKQIEKHPTLSVILIAGVVAGLVIGLSYLAATNDTLTVREFYDRGGTR